MSQKTSLKTRSTNSSPATKVKAATPKGMGEGLNASATPFNPMNSWEFKVTGRGSSGWMSWVKEDGAWVKLRASETSFISAVTAIEPELMRLAFPHRATKKRTV